MKIIDNKKDYYDYVSGVNGIDNDVVFDRRGSFAINDTTENGFIKLWFHSERFDGDKDTRSISRYAKRAATDEYNFIVEAGYMQYCVNIKRIKNEETGIDTLQPTLVKRRRVKEKVGNTPLALIPCRYYFSWSNNKKDEFYPAYDTSWYIDNPILANTYIPKLIPAEEIWNELYNYLINVKDKPIEDKRSDVEKAESHGFDKKTSFRGPNK